MAWMRGEKKWTMGQESVLKGERGGDTQDSDTFVQQLREGRGLFRVV
jgi:hypothetical protein